MPVGFRHSLVKRGAVAFLAGIFMTMFVTSAASAEAPLTVTYHKVICARYTDVPANRVPSNVDDTVDQYGHHWQELDASRQATASTPSDIPAACHTASDWSFQFLNRQGGDVIDTYTTGQDGTKTIILSDTLTDLARSSGGLWVREITQPAAGFGALRCYKDVLNGDNLDYIYNVPADTTQVYCIAYNVAGPGITLTKTANASTYEHVGQHITYTYTIIDTSNVPTGSAQFTVSDDKINNNVPFDCGSEISLTPDHDAPVTAPSAGSWVSCTHDYTVTQADIDHGSLTNVATASGAGLTTLPASMTLTGPAAAPRITLTKTASPAAYSSADEPITYTYKIINTGNVTLSSSQFTVSDNKISGGAFNCGSSQALSPNTATIDSPSDGSYVTCTKTYHVTPDDVVNRSVTNTATASGASLTSNTVSATVNLAKLTVTKTSSRTTYTAAGQLINYIYSLTNNGNSTLTGPFTVTDDALGTVTCGNASVTLAPGASLSTSNCGSKSYTTTQSDFDAAKTITNRAYGTGYVGTMAVNSATVTVEVTATGTQTRTISIDKSVVPGTTYAHVNDTIAYHYTIRNTGNVTLGPAQFTISDNQIGSPKGTAFNCGSATTTLAPDATVTCDATYTVVQGDIDAGSVTNIASASGGADLTSGTDTVTVNGTQGRTITIVKTAAETSYSKVGDTLTYTYKVINTGNVTLDGQFTVSDDQIGSSKGTPFDCGTPNTLYPNSATLEDPSKGSFLTCTATYTIAQADLDRGHVTNVATATVVANDRTITSDPATVTVQAAQGPALGIVKTADRTTFTKAGETITYTYVLANTGNVALGEPFTVSDDKINGGTAFTCGAATSLAVGASVTCTATYTVTLADLDAGKVVNTAIGHGRLGERTIDTASQLVTVTLQSLESVRAETATPTHAVTPPPTTVVGGPSGDSPTPFPALMICLAFGGLGLLAVQRQRRTLRR
ncbi:MAG TPA: hypothetical protein VF349_01915 [Candidatus Limnocylindrales bacterium]